MAQSFANVLVHLVFSTKERRNLIDPNLREPMAGYFVGILQNLSCPSLAIGVMPDHVHLLVSLSRTTTIANLVEEVKVGSSKWMKTQGARHALFGWQSGYGIFSVSASQRDRVVKYILNQEEHHRTISFKEELLRLLKRHQISYEEKYLWG